MKAIRIAALGVALLAGSAAVAGAQAGTQAPAQQGGGRGGFNRSMNGIELTDAQKAKVAEIQAKYQPEMQAIRESMQGGGDRAEAFKKIQALNDKRNPEIRAAGRSGRRNGDGRRSDWDRDQRHHSAALHGGTETRPEREGRVSPHGGRRGGFGRRGGGRVCHQDDWMALA